jgi:hypothetical protein
MRYRAESGGAARRPARGAAFAVALTTALLSLGSVPAAAQVGLASAVGSVTLMAHVDPQGSISSVTPPRQTGQAGPLTEAVTTVRLSSNTGYRLIVRSLEGSTSRMWARSTTGEFVLLNAVTSVPVARATRGSGETLQNVYFRFEAPVSGGTPPPLPVRYELAIDPTS